MMFTLLGNIVSSVMWGLLAAIVLTCGLYLLVKSLYGNFALSLKSVLILLFAFVLFLIQGSLTAGAIYAKGYVDDLGQLAVTTLGENGQALTAATQAYAEELSRIASASAGESSEVLNELLSGENGQALQELLSGENGQALQELLTGENGQALQELLSGNNSQTMSELMTGENSQALTELASAVQLQQVVQTLGEQYPMLSAYLKDMDFSTALQDGVSVAQVVVDELRTDINWYMVRRVAWSLAFFIVAAIGLAYTRPRYTAPVYTDDWDI